MPGFNPFKKITTNTLFVFSLFCYQSKAQVFPVDTLMRNGDRLNRINIVYLGDGYLSPQVPAYLNQCMVINDALFAQTPFTQYKPFFNAFAVRGASAGEGAKHPGTAVDENTSAGQPVVNPDNKFGSSFDFFGIHRLLVPQNENVIHSVLASNLPDYDQVFIIVNSPYYGGSGGIYATTSTHSLSTAIAIHEIGHSFGGLADEYWAGDIYAGEKPNMTSNANPQTVKWKNWLGINAVGIYPYGPDGNAALWFRPHEGCKMQYEGNSFCSVCTEKLIDRMHEMVNMADAFVPATTAFTLTNDSPVSFSVTPVQNVPSTISLKWYLNGAAVPFAGNQNSVTIPYASFISGANTVRAELVDSIPFAKSFLPGAGYINHITWTVNNSLLVPVKLINFTGSVLNRDEGELSWTIANAGDLQQFELQKSKDGKKYTGLQQIPKDGNRVHFDYRDQNLYNPLSYYRLKITEVSGQVYYSNIIVLRNEMDKLVYKVYQDADKHLYRLKLSLNATENISISITDASGRQVLQKKFGNKSGSFTDDINLSDKAPGIYFMTIIIGDRKYTVSLLAK